MNLTTRQYDLLMYLLAHDDFVTISEAAGFFGLSPRTVQREMDTILDYLGSDSGLIEKKTGKGIRFAGTQERRRRLKESVARLSELVPVYSQAERIDAMLSMLLTEGKPRKIIAFASGLGVSEATVGSDLNICEKWLLDSGIRLVRKKGVGIFVDAGERTRRQAIIRLYYQKRGSSDRVEDVAGNFLNAAGIRKMFDPVVAGKLDRMLKDIPELQGLRSNDRARHALVAHLYLIYMRVAQGAGIQTRSSDLDAGDMTEKLAGRIITAMERLLSVSIPPGENEYLSALLRCAHGLNGVSNPEIEPRARRMAGMLIKRAESLTGVMLDPIGVFSEALVKHLIPTIERLQLGMNIRNPMMDEVKQHYASLYKLAQDCSEPISKELGMEIPDTEICYLALHLGVAIEDSRSYQSRKRRAVICCPSGMVTARLLALRVGHEFSDIEVYDVLSTANINYAQLLESGVEIVISTVPLQDCPLPYAHVSSFLTDDEKNHLWQVLKACRGDPKAGGSDGLQDEFPQRLCQMKDVIDTILQILGNFFVAESKSIRGLDEAIAFVGKRVAADSGGAAQIMEDLRLRERHGSTTTADRRAVLLHCRTAGVSQTWFGVIRPGRFVCQNGGQPFSPDTVLVMLAPKRASKHVLGVMGAISQSIVENSSFMETLRRGDRSECYNAVEKVLNKYYKIFI